MSLSNYVPSNSFNKAIFTPHFSNIARYTVLSKDICYKFENWLHSGLTYIQRLRVPSFIRIAVGIWFKSDLTKNIDLVMIINYEEEELPK